MKPNAENTTGGKVMYFIKATLIGLLLLAVVFAVSAIIVWLAGSHPNLLAVPIVLMVAFALGAAWISEIEN